MFNKIKKYKVIVLKDNDLSYSNNKLSCILDLIDKYKQKNQVQLLNFISLFIELFYYELSLKNSKNLNYYSANKFKLINQINYAKKFNLDKKNLFISLKETLVHESK